MNHVFTGTSQGNHPLSPSPNSARGTGGEVLSSPDMLVQQLIELFRLLDIRRVARLREHDFLILPTVGFVLIEYVAQLAYHRLRRKHLRTGPARNSPQR